MERLDNIPTSIAVRAILLDENNRVLLVKRAKGVFAEDKWCLPGGKPNPDENMADAVERKTKEEVAISFEPRYVGGFENPDVSNGARWFTHYFEGKVPEDYMGLGLNEEENSEVGFFSEGELGLLDIAFDHRQVLEVYFSGSYFPSE